MNTQNKTQFAHDTELAKTMPHIVEISPQDHGSALMLKATQQIDAVGTLHDYAKKLWEDAAELTEGDEADKAEAAVWQQRADQAWEVAGELLQSADLALHIARLLLAHKTQ